MNNLKPNPINEYLRLLVNKKGKSLAYNNLYL